MLYYTTRVWMSLDYKNEGLTLKNAKDLSAPNATPKDSIKIPASNVLSFSPGLASGAGTMSKINDCEFTTAKFTHHVVLQRISKWPDNAGLLVRAATTRTELPGKHGDPQSDIGVTCHSMKEYTK